MSCRGSTPPRRPLGVGLVKVRLLGVGLVKVRLLGVALVRVRLLGVALVGMVTLAGCGGAGAAAPTAPPSASRTGPPASSSPSQAVPDQAVPDQAVPDQAVPDQAVPDQAVPGPAASTVAPGRPAALTGGIQVSIGSLELLTLTAHAETEVAGPAIAVNVVVRNVGHQAFDLSVLIIDATYGSSTPASSTDAAPSRPLAGELAGGVTATGVYVFLAPRSALNSLRLLVSSEGPDGALVLPG